MCKNTNGSNSMDSMMAEHQKFLEECERRLQDAKATSRANREAIEQIAKDIENIATEVNVMNTMVRENSKATEDVEPERTINAESTQPCADKAESVDWDEFFAELDAYYDETDARYSEDRDYPDDWKEDEQDYPDDWEDPDEWENEPEDYYDDCEDDLEDWEEEEDPNDLESYFDEEFSPSKAAVYTSWRGYEFVESKPLVTVGYNGDLVYTACMPKVVNARSMENVVAKVAAEESGDPLWDCWYDEAKHYEPDSKKFAKEETEDIGREIAEELFDMVGITIEDFLADEAYLCDKIIQRGQVAKRRKKTYWRGQRLRKNAITIWKNYSRRWNEMELYYNVKKRGSVMKNCGVNWKRAECIIGKALKKKVISFA